MQQQRKTKCDFCAHKTASGCSVGQSYYNCKQATDEFYTWLNSLKKGNNR